MISADTFCCTVQVTRHRKDVKHFSSKRVSWHSQKEASMGGKHRTRTVSHSGSQGSQPTGRGVEGAGYGEGGWRGCEMLLGGSLLIWKFERN